MPHCSPGSIRWATATSCHRSLETKELFKIHFLLQTPNYITITKINTRKTQGKHEWIYTLSFIQRMDVIKEPNIYEPPAPSGCLTQEQVGVACWTFSQDPQGNHQRGLQSLT